MNLESLKSAVVEYFLELDERERSVIVLGIPLLLIILYISIVFVPLKTLESSYRSKLELALKETREISEMVYKFESLKEKVGEVERKIPSASFNPSGYLEKKAKALGINVKRVKVSSGRSMFNVSSETVSLSFSESSIDSIAKLIRDVEIGGYPFKAVSLDVKDLDDNGLVSGRVDFVIFLQGEP